MIVNYTPSTSIIANPERGLQKYSKNVSSTGTYSFVNQTTLINNRTGADKVTVLYRYIMLTAYMNTDVIDNTYLTNLQTDFDRIRNAGIKVILRVSYNNDTTTNTQPLKARILAHIQALAPIINLNKDVITFIQAGFIGKYGEWYYTGGSTEFGDTSSINTTQWVNRKEVVDAMLNSFDASIPLQVRYANAKKQMYGSGQINTLNAYQNTPVSRIGFYNDALLNEDGDMGTYSINGCTNPVNTVNYNYIANASQFLPLSGESNGINPCDGGFRTTGINAVNELNVLNFSVLNRDYEPNVWQGWINTGHYDEILRNLGYRLVLVSSNLVGNSLTLNINNVGYAKLLFQKKFYLVFRNISNVEYKRLLPIDIRTLNKGNNTLNITVPNDVPLGTYSLFIHIADNTTSLEARPEYSIQFANTSIFESNTGYNNLNQTITISDTTTTTTTLSPVTTTTSTSLTTTTTTISLTTTTTTRRRKGNRCCR